MIAILQWTTLTVCAVLAAFRLPGAFRGENRSLFFIYVLLVAGLLLSINGPYVAIDGVLGGVNLANLVLRFVVFGTVFALGLRIARGFGARDALRLMTGRVGIAVAVASSAALVAVFLMMDTAGSSAGLVSVYAKDPRSAALVELYGAAGRVYPAFVALALLPALVRTVRGGLPALLRTSAALLALGSVALTLSLSSPLIGPPFGYLRFVFNYTAVLCLLTGLALIWLSKTVTGAKLKRKTYSNGFSRLAEPQNDSRGP
ncbi:hypothetical protein [Pseudarthrobacter sp. 1C304]|uniref:hypothetical protein n=1 Tax=Pseudarthrobacter sp. 1C304 TaxID=3457438 RepID=UPI003FD48D32